LAEIAQAATVVRTKRSRLSRARIVDWAFIVLAGLGAALFAIPLIFMFSSSLRPLGDAYKLPPAWFPTQFQYENYLTVLNHRVPFFDFALNSTKITFWVTLGRLVTGSMAAFAFARLRFPGRNVLFILLLASLMVPIQVTIIPIFLMMSKFKLVDNHLALILPGLTSAFGVFLLRQFFMTMPEELFDAARIDGAGPWRLYWNIAIPQAGPALAALTIITFNQSWNDYFTPLIFINTWENMTLPLGISALKGRLESGNPSVVMAAVALAILPVLILFLAAQRYFIEGVTMSGIKG
jgi:multiple sugar transport system permease protein